LLTALPKNTGVSSPASTAGRDRRPPRAFEHCDSSTTLDTSGKHGVAHDGIAEIMHGHRGAKRAARDALEEMHHSAGDRRRRGNRTPSPSGQLTG
jgi:hypothetical protein